MRLEKVRRFEKVREGQRRLEKVRESRTKLESRKMKKHETPTMKKNVGKCMKKHLATKDFGPGHCRPTLSPCHPWAPALDARTTHGMESAVPDPRPYWTQKVT